MTIGRRATLFINGVEIDGNFEVQTMATHRTPLFWIEVDPSSPRPIVTPDQHDLTAAIGYVAKQLHIVAHVERNIHKAFVRRMKGGQYDFGFRRYVNDNLVATLTAITDNRVRVDYHDGRESEILYL